MKCRILPLIESEINNFLATPGIRIASKHVGQNIERVGEISSGTAVIGIFYDTPEDDAAFKDRILIEQHNQMERLLDIAREVKKDDRYAALKNNTQREIFLFTRYNIPANDAGKVAELLKPEMAPVLGA